jgi:crossover junction endodeoxyribonuclease RuvC
VELGIEVDYFGANAKSALATGQARGAALVAAASYGLEVGEYSPTQIKQVTVGEGHAVKQQVQYMVKALLGLDHEPAPDHAADALAVALCHARLRRLV